MLSVFMLSVIMAACHYAECRGALKMHQTECDQKIKDHPISEEKIANTVTEPEKCQIFELRVELKVRNI